jgi:hypothetical protein
MADIYDTSLEQSALTPDFGGWSEGDHVVDCYVQRVDGNDLTRSAKDSGGATFARSNEVPVYRLKAGDCFSPVALGSAFDLGPKDTTSLTDCAASPNGIFFGRGVIPLGIGQSYPGKETVDDAAFDVCDQQFTTFFGVSPDGFSYQYWSPTEQTWQVEDREVLCAVLDDGGLPATLDYQSYRTVYELATGTCFLLPPVRTADELDLDDKVELVDCGTDFNGQLFGSGELPDGPNPGDEQANTMALDICNQLFAGFVGLSFDESTLDYIYWAPTETSWTNGNRRYACVFLSDDTRSGTFESAAV